MLRILTAVLMLGFASAAVATEITADLQLVIANNAVQSCELLKASSEPGASADGKDEIRVNAVTSTGADASTAPVMRALTYVAKSSAGQTIALEKKEAGIVISLVAPSSGVLQGATLSVQKGGVDTACSDVTLSVRGANPESASEAASFVENPTLIDAARRYAMTQPRLESTSGNAFTGRKTVRIVHLPTADLEPVLPAPESITEEDTIELSLVLPKTMLGSIEVLECKRPTFDRILGKPLKKIDSLLKLQSGIEEAPDFRMYIYRRQLRCSDKLRYQVVITDLAGTELIKKEISHDIQPVYQFAWGVVGGFDLGQPTDIDTEAKKKEDGSTEKVVVRRHETTGVKPLITLSMHPCGYNLEDWTYCELFSPFIGMDPTRADQGLVFGLNPQFMPGVGLAFGVSLFKSEKLQGLKVGDVVEEGQNPSTRKVFNSDSVGFYIGINFTDKIWTALFSGKDDSGDK